MRAFVDTSAIIAVLNADDRFHKEAKVIWQRELNIDTSLITTNYVLLETTALLQHRIGLRAVDVFYSEISPVLEIEWVDRDAHHAAMTSVLTSGRRQLSLVDCVSFEVIRRRSVDCCFTFDKHFSEQGFRLLGGMV